jgi:hypothetical protein
MLSVIAKVLLICVVVLAAIVVALNFTGVYTWGTVGFSAPDAAPCHQMGRGFKAKPVLTEVRWSWVLEQSAGGDDEGLQYGWSCHFEFGDDSKADISYPRTPSQG